VKPARPSVGRSLTLIASVGAFGSVRSLAADCQPLDRQPGVGGPTLTHYERVQYAMVANDRSGPLLESALPSMAGDYWCREFGGTSGASCADCAPTPPALTDAALRLRLVTLSRQWTSRLTATPEPPAALRAARPPMIGLRGEALTVLARSGDELDLDGCTEW
jgi:hypothetical protein